jgi:hypothetical protein
VHCVSRLPSLEHDFDCNSLLGRVSVGGPCPVIYFDTIHNLLFTCCIKTPVRWFFGGVRVAYLFSFLCCAFYSSFCLSSSCTPLFVFIMYTFVYILLKTGSNQMKVEQRQKIVQRNKSMFSSD